MVVINIPTARKIYNRILQKVRKEMSDPAREAYDLEKKIEKEKKEEDMKMSAIGAAMLKKQAELAEKYGYKPLPVDVGLVALYHYLDKLPEEFRGKTSWLPVGAEVQGKKMQLYTLEGTPIAKKYDRIVIGHYGAFIEISDKDIQKLCLKVQEGEEYRINDPKFAGRVKYQWYTADDASGCKLYYQQRGVTYADYKPGFWYISPYEAASWETLKETS